MLCDKLSGQSINENLNVFELAEDELGKFPAARKNCLELVWQTWQAAVNNFRAAQPLVWNGEEALICSCFGVSELTIENVIAENLLGTIEDVAQMCRAGSGCGSCQPLIQEILDNVWRGDS